jgi:NADPH:quinone reductase-like Zn-dependent oxidoreductase
MAENQAAWLTEAGAYPFAVNDGPKPTPGPEEIIIKNAAVAIVRNLIMKTYYPLLILNAEPRRLENPVCVPLVFISISGILIFRTHGRYLNTYPFILGEDAVGIVEAVGSGVTRFSKGQRVVA